MHHIVIIAMFTLCYSIISHATVPLFYHASVLILEKLLNTTCTVVATSMMILWKFGVLDSS